MKELASALVVAQVQMQAHAASASHPAPVVQWWVPADQVVPAAAVPLSVPVASHAVVADALSDRYHVKTGDDRQNPALCQPPEARSPRPTAEHVAKL